MFKDLVKDNVSYVEIHSSFNGMYDLQSYFNPFTELDLCMFLQEMKYKKNIQILISK